MKSISTLQYTTPSAKPQTLSPKWYLINGEDQIVGRLASEIASLLTGKKHKTNYTPHVAVGDYVIIINGDKVRFTGKKEKGKSYIRHTGYPGGQRATTPAELRAKRPTEILRRSVKGMIMKNKLGRKLLGNLFIYAGSEHPHQAQNPEVINPTA